MTSHHRDAPAAVRVAGISASVFNLAKTLTGGGVLSLPFAVHEAGIVPGLVLLILVAVTAHFSIFILVSVSRRCGGRSFEDVVRLAFGFRAQLFVMVCMILVAFFLAVAYFVLIGDMTTALVEFAVGYLPAYTRQVTMFSSMILVFFASVPKSLYALRYMSAFGLFSLSVLVVCLVIRLRVPASDTASLPRSKNVLVASRQWQDITYSLPIFVLSYFCQFNVIHMFRELKNPTHERIKLVLYVVITLVTVYYAAIATVGYLVALEGTSGDIMNSFPASDLLINACRLLLTFSVGSGIPLVMLPGRDALYRLYWISGMAQWCSRSNKPHVEVANPLNNSSIEMGLPTIKSTSSRVGSTRAVHKASFSGDGAGGAATVPVRGPRSQADVLADALAQAQARADQIDAEQRRKQRMKRKSLHVDQEMLASGGRGGDGANEPPLQGLQHEDSLGMVYQHVTKPPGTVWRLVCTGLFLLLSVTIAAWVPSVVVVWTLMGSTLANIIGYILPCLIYLKLRGFKAWNSRKIGAWVLLVLSTVTGIVCTAVSIAKLL